MLRFEALAAALALTAPLALAAPANSADVVLRTAVVRDAHADVNRVQLGSDSEPIAHATDLYRVRYSDERSRDLGHVLHVVLRVADVPTNNWVRNQRAGYAADIAIDRVPKYTLLRVGGNQEVRQFRSQELAPGAACNNAWLWWNKDKEQVHFTVPIRCIGASANVSVRAQTEWYNNAANDEWLTVDVTDWGPEISIK